MEDPVYKKIKMLQQQAREQHAANPNRVFPKSRPKTNDSLSNFIKTAEQGRIFMALLKAGIL
ncbi:MAG: hypothetical protein DI535_13940 [Citrobacter freundii]|nr:MAG: hypothetical protein DI535_13940 [Citrobacter freundii]